mmetsp:Transcript_21184/g.44280  ORF Transcript_21184/g.44280 Transcript_21184/m.44280 type:complete len:653 (-) Transcript_21184:983-2941(-)|eukprot:CAMPEP_0172463190 /NCGR_PEP_ID=MMETSP1065-20121228/46279_1 /TAXON_ID=265537 /ORGANISM="Amphiprora paludosa, Strain CCMP125" /LENGTH=652 /DNA_ID=CAMNT_0013219077 /DNA_START=170 /DNA_END=2128 /DNA_ORIENTATION=-
MSYLGAEGFVGRAYTAKARQSRRARIYDNSKKLSGDCDDELHLPSSNRPICNDDQQCPRSNISGLMLPSLGAPSRKLEVVGQKHSHGRRQERRENKSSVAIRKQGSSSSYISRARPATSLTSEVIKRRVGATAFDLKKRGSATAPSGTTCPQDIMKQKVKSKRAASLAAVLSLPSLQNSPSLELNDTSDTASATSGSTAFSSGMSRKLHRDMQLKKEKGGSGVASVASTSSHDSATSQSSWMNNQMNHLLKALNAHVVTEPSLQPKSILKPAPEATLAAMASKKQRDGQKNKKKAHVGGRYHVHQQKAPECLTQFDQPPSGGVDELPMVNQNQGKGGHTSIPGSLKHIDADAIKETKKVIESITKKSEESLDLSLSNLRYQDKSSRAQDELCDSKDMIAYQSKVPTKSEGHADESGSTTESEEEVTRYNVIVKVNTKEDNVYEEKDASLEDRSKQVNERKPRITPVNMDFLQGIIPGGFGGLAEGKEESETNGPTKRYYSQTALLDMSDSESETATYASEDTRRTFASEGTRRTFASEDTKRTSESYESEPAASMDYASIYGLETVKNSRHQVQDIRNDGGGSPKSRRQRQHEKCIHKTTSFESDASSFSSLSGEYWTGYDDDAQKMPVDKLFFQETDRFFRSLDPSSFINM